MPQSSPTIEAGALAELPPGVEAIPLGHDRAGNPIVGLVYTIPPPEGVRTRGEAYEYLYSHLARKLRSSLAAEGWDNPRRTDVLLRRIFPSLWMAYNMTPVAVSDLTKSDPDLTAVPFQLTTDFADMAASARPRSP